MLTKNLSISLFVLLILVHSARFEFLTIIALYIYFITYLLTCLCFTLSVRSLGMTWGKQVTGMCAINNIRNVNQPLNGYLFYTVLLSLFKTEYGR